LRFTESCWFLLANPSQHCASYLTLINISRFHRDLPREELPKHIFSGATQLADFKKYMFQPTYDSRISRKNCAWISFRIAYSPNCFLLWNIISLAIQLQYNSAAQDISTRLHVASSYTSILPETQYSQAESCDVYEIKNYFIVECYSPPIIELTLTELEIITDFEHIHAID